MRLGPIGRYAGRAMMAPFTAVGAGANLTYDVLKRPVGITALATAVTAAVPFVGVGLMGAGVAKSVPFLARTAFRTTAGAGRYFFKATDAVEGIGAHNWGGRAAREMGRGIGGLFKGTTEAVIGDVRRPWLSMGPGVRGASTRRATQTGLGIAAGLGGFAYSTTRTQEAPAMGYEPYPGAVSQPAGAMQQGGSVPFDMGADGDLVHALHQNYGSGRYM